MLILGISGSLRRDSYNTGLLRTAAQLGPVDVELWDGLKAIPPYDADDEADPAPAVVELRSALAGADGFLFATPEYNHSVPGHLKNALDWASRPLATNPIRNKPAAVVGAADVRPPIGHLGSAAGPHVLDRARHLFRVAHAAERQAPALGRQRARDTQADAAGATGDQGDPRAHERSCGPKNVR